MSDQITFEHPLNEKSRTLLRLSHLFAQFNHHLALDHKWEARSAISSLIDITAIITRSDIKSELIKQLENYNLYLSSISNKPGVDSTRLEQILDDLTNTRQRILQIEGQAAQSIRNNEFINSIIQRSAIPGGTFDFDLPEYHHWLNQPFDNRFAHLNKWQTELSPLHKGVDLLLSMIRNSAPANKKQADKGFYQQSLSDFHSAQLIRVTLDKSDDLFAEISGGKHRFSIRFLSSNFNGPTHQSDQNIAFNLSICAM